jgi:glycerol-3-phosphate dehydrogenase (NAD(P)+)
LPARVKAARGDGTLEERTEKVTIIGDGQMGLVMADALAFQGISVRLWGPFAADIERLAVSRRSDRLRDLALRPEVQVLADERQALQDATLILSAIPSQYLRAVWKRLAQRLSGSESLSIVSVTKGIENETLMRPTQIIREKLAGEGGTMCVTGVLSGPTIAAEIAKHLPASLVAASDDPDLAQRVQDILRVPWLRVYRHDDVVGVEVAGAAKNVIALAAGIVDGLGLGANAKSALLARGLSEIARLGVAMGARLDTFFGVAGVGDLATTCFSPEGRNRTCGERLASGEALDAILASSTSVVEGVPTTRSVMELARQHNVDMPITEAVNAILFEGLSPQDAIRSLMTREAKAETVG